MSRESQHVSAENSAGDEAVARLLAALRAAGLPDAWLGLEHGDTIDLLDDRGLHAYVLALRDSRMREVGKQPADETMPALCRHCGPIWLAPEVAVVAPTIAGWPRVLGCPWCHVRNRQAIPRPHVACASCKHFEPDAINPAAGMGRCTTSREVAQREPLPFPGLARLCAEWRPA